MKLLIVDDENLTRKGIVDSVAWEPLGINEIIEASNGVQGLAMMKKYNPEIIITDVRMPKMDGIRLAESIQAGNPDSIIIFMSGYSDTEYLKAAIRLRAINYVEKPVNISELTAAVETAVQTYRTIQQTKRTNLMEQLEKHSRLALLLLHPITPQVQEIAASLSLFQKIPIHITTIILQLNTPISSLKQEDIENNTEQLRNHIKTLHLNEIHAQTHDRNFIFHIFSSRSAEISELIKITDFAGSLYKPFCTYSLSVGKTVSSMDNVHRSYGSAVVLLQSTFTCPYNSTLIYSLSRETTGNALPDLYPEFRDALDTRNHDGALEVSRKLFQSIQGCRGLIPSQIKDYYYRYFSLISESLGSNGIMWSENDRMSDIWNHISLCVNLHELRTLLDDCIDQYFKMLHNIPAENPTIYMIKDFIARQYPNETLSIQDISDYVRLSPAYLCTLFKNETGITINQYMTDFRMAKAKIMLEDHRYKITEISAKVGYSDSGYFGKSFRRIVGLSPSEYREKMQK